MLSLQIFQTIFLNLFTPNYLLLSLIQGGGGYHESDTNTFFVVVFCLCLPRGELPVLWKALPPTALEPRRNVHIKGSEAAGERESARRRPSERREGSFEVSKKAEAPRPGHGSEWRNHLIQ